MPQPQRQESPILGQSLESKELIVIHPFRLASRDLRDAHTLENCSNRSLVLGGVAGRGKLARGRR
jgi:hypothetical protein